MSSQQPNHLADPADRIFDTLLEEVLRDAPPPDLTARILAAQASAKDDQVATRESVADWIDSTDRPSRPLARRRRRSRVSPVTWTAASIVVALVVGFGWIMYDSGRPRQTTQAPEDAESNSAASNTHDVPRSRSTNHAPNRRTEGEPIDLTPPWDRPPTTPELTQQDPTPRNPVPPRSDREIVSAIERQLQRHWEVAAASPSPPAEDSIWCRRVYLKMIGRIPTVEELNRFLEMDGDDRRERLVDTLLNDPRYEAEFVEYWATLWTNVLIGRSGGMGSSKASREGLIAFLRSALQENQPYDEWVEQLLSAEGTGEPGEPDFNGAVNFWIEHYSPDAVRLTDKATRVFWGVPLGCVRCHDQMDGPAKQREFWSLNAVLRTAKRPSSDPPRLAARANGSANPVYYERPDGTLAVAQPMLPDGRPVDDRLLDQPRQLRQAVARSWSQSPLVARALVNRMWAHFFGYGFTRSVDDMAPPRQITHPELLEFLASQTAAHHFDTRRLIRWIVLSDAFSRSSRVTDGNEKDVPERGTLPMFTRYYTKPLGLEAVYQSLALVANPQGKVDPNDLIAARKHHAQQLTRRRDNDEGGEVALFQQGVQKSWMLMNSPLMQRATSAQQRGFLHRVAESNLSPTQQVEHLFLASLSRKPTKGELKMALTLLDQRSDDPAGALEDIWWALLNSNEFLSNH